MGKSLVAFSSWCAVIVSDERQLSNQVSRILMVAFVLQHHISLTHQTSTKHTSSTMLGGLETFLQCHYCQLYQWTSILGYLEGAICFVSLDCIVSFICIAHSVHHSMYHSTSSKRLGPCLLHTCICMLLNHDRPALHDQRPHWSATAIYHQ